jgi:hypothetical protein
MTLSGVSVGEYFNAYLNIYLVGMIRTRETHRNLC